MITTAPQPRIGELFANLRKPAASNLASNTPQLAGAGTPFWFSRSAWALHAISRWWCDHNGKSAGKSAPMMMIPDYFCNESLGPLRSTDVDIHFYPIAENLNPDWQQCRRIAEEFRPDIFVLVHYFGRAADGPAAKNFCNQTNAILVEDCAHVLRPTEAIGNHGKFSFFSPYKFLPVPHGGLLIVNKAEFVQGMTQTVDGLDRAAPGIATWVFERLLRKALPPIVLHRLSKQGKLGFFDDPKPSPLPNTPQINATARRMIAAASANFGEIVNRRKRNARILRDCLADVSGCRPLFSDVEEGEAPYRFVLKFDHSEAADKLFRESTALGCPVESWPDLPPEIVSSTDPGQVALSLRNTLVCFPVHQTIAGDEIRKFCGLLKRSRAKTSAI